jgi:hypothetical protein
MTLSVLKTGVLNVYYTFADDSMEKPFEVPLDIIDAKKDELSEDKKLSDFMSIMNPDLMF